MIKNLSEDPSVARHDPKYNIEKDVLYRKKMNKYFSQSLGTNIEKLENFTKYVPRQMLTQFLYRYELFKKIVNVEGSIVECGVFFGGGLMSWAQLSAIFEPVNFIRRIIGFDTFAGFPSLSEKDAFSTAESAKVGGLAAKTYEDLQHCIKLFDLNRFISHIPKVMLVKGDACKTIPKFIEEHADLVVSLLYLDFDIYEPTRVAPKHFLSRMPKGAIIGFDELHSETYQGETLAVLEEVGIRNLSIERFYFEPGSSYAILK